MSDIFNVELLFEKDLIEILLLVVSLILIFIIQLITNRKIQKSIDKIQNNLFQLSKYSEVQNTYSTQFNDHFNLIDRRLKTLEEITSVTSRDIASMAEGISGEVGVGKAIELARRGATVEEIMENSNLKKDQAELIVKFHGEEATNL